MPGVFQDSKSKDSNMRMNLTIFISMVVVVTAVLLALVVKESYKEQPDYSGLAMIITATLGSGGMGLIAKAYQKKFENDTRHD